MTRLVEFRTYQLTPGAGAEFHELATRQSIPMARASGMDVLAHGPSLHDADAYFLIRAYDKLEHRDALEAAFYASAAWRAMRPAGSREPASGSCSPTARPRACATPGSWS